MIGIDLERYRRAEIRPARPGRAVPGAPAFLGKVTTATASIFVGKFLLVNPATVTGAEAEGGAGSFAVDASTSVPVYLAGPGKAAQGEYLVCRGVDYRWVAERFRGTPPSTGCSSCFAAMPPLKMTDSMYGGPVNQLVVTGSTPQFELDGITVDPGQTSTGNCHTFGALTTNFWYIIRCSSDPFGLFPGDTNRLYLELRLWACADDSPVSTGNYAAPIPAGHTAQQSPTAIFSDSISAVGLDCTNPNLVFTWTHVHTLTGWSGPGNPYAGGGTTTVVKQ